MTQGQRHADDMDAAEFRRRFNRDPVNDDLDRVNCDRAGDVGHFGCGVCRHNLPTFECAECLRTRAG